MTLNNARLVQRIQELEARVLHLEARIRQLEQEHNTLLTKPKGTNGNFDDS